MTAPLQHERTNQVRLVGAQLLGGIGIASGVAVGGLLAEQVSGKTSAAGLVQTASVLGTGLLAIPLARLAARCGRNWSLGSGFALGGVGGILVVLSAITVQLWILLLGMLLFGAGTAANLQARYAAAELASPEAQGRAMSVVVWATTVGSVLGPNLSEPGSKLGSTLGIIPFSGPFIFSGVAFLFAALVASTLRAGITLPGQREEQRLVGTVEALRTARRNPTSLFAMSVIVGGQMMMTSVMVMTPIHMHHRGISLAFIGVTLSIHTLGMYAASPVFGWLVDKFGSRKVSLASIGIFVTALTLGGLDALSEHSYMPRLFGSLFLLGLGWSASLIAGSSLLNQSIDTETRIPLQGAVDSLMNIGAAILASLAGSVLVAGGFLAVNAMSACVLIPVLFFGIRSIRFSCQNIELAGHRD